MSGQSRTINKEFVGRFARTRRDIADASITAKQDNPRRCEHTAKKTGPPRTVAALAYGIVPPKVVPRFASVPSPFSRCSMAGPATASGIIGRRDRDNQGATGRGCQYIDRQNSLPHPCSGCAGHDKTRVDPSYPDSPGQP